MRKRSSLIFMGVFAFAAQAAWADGVSGHMCVPHTHPYPGNPYSGNPLYNSICWGYAQGRAAGRTSTDPECDPSQTYIDQISTQHFGQMIAGTNFANLQVGDIIVWGTVRSGLSGHAAYVVSIPAHTPDQPLTPSQKRDIRVDQVPYADGPEEKNVRVGTVNGAQGNFVGYHSTGNFGRINLIFKNSFGSGILHAGKDKGGNWLTVDHNQSKLYDEHSFLDIEAVNNQYYPSGVKQVFYEWDDGPQTISRTIQVSGSNIYQANFHAEYEITVRNQFSCVAGNLGVVKVNSSTKDSPHLEIVEQPNSITIEAPGQVYNGIEYTFAQWTDGVTTASRTFAPQTNGTYTATYTYKPRMMSYYNRRVVSSAGQNITLAWDQHPNSGVQYQIWRRVKPQGGSLGPPTLQATLNNGVTSWVDYEYVMTEGYTVDLLEYDVRSYYTCGSTSVSADSDFLTVFGEGGLLKISAIANQARAPFAPESYVVSALPNPFNPITTLRYQLRENAHVRLSIYDLHGRLVKTLVKEEKLAGYYSMPWQSIDASGRNTSSGVYFFEFVAIPLNGAAPYRESGKPLLAK